MVSGASRARVLIAVNCGQPGGTCFCVSMKTGPRAQSGFDLVLTEMQEDGRHAFTVEAGSERGREVRQLLPTEEAGAIDLEASARCTERAVPQMGRSMDVTGVPVIQRARPSIALTDPDSDAAIDAMRIAAEKRVEGILGNTRRQHYSHAALLVASCVRLCAQEPHGRTLEMGHGSPPALLAS